MKNRAANIVAIPVGLVLTGFAFLITLASPILAQQPAPVPSRDRTDPARARFEDTSRREMQLRGLGSKPDSSVDPKKLQALMAQVAQDFERILILHNEIVRALAANKKLNYDFVADASAEIKKRATRLQSTLRLHKADTNEPKAHLPLLVNEAEMKEALISFCKQIGSFVKNPVIENPGTINSEQLANARRDLESIIESGDSLKKNAERLKKIPK